MAAWGGGGCFSLAAGAGEGKGSEPQALGWKTRETRETTETACASTGVP